MAQRLSRAEYAARGRVGGLTLAAKADMHAIAARARDGLSAKFLREADGDPARAEILRRLFYARLALSAVTARTKKAPAPENHGADASEVRSAEPTSPPPPP